MDKGPWHGGKLVMVGFLVALPISAAGIHVVAGGEGVEPWVGAWVAWMLLTMLVLVPMTVISGRSRVHEWHAGTLISAWILSSLPALLFSLTIYDLYGFEDALISFALTWFPAGAPPQAAH